ncbi:MAG: secretion system protein [Syntrophomonadaceae bacterium]|jgi:tight adherence protein B|nr:type II secretion system F family protein [Thermoanaerobacterales bacterium]NLN21679.1 secretion system protein [Syntrophomonadaceae bacterium]HAF17326.1 secretion system protein [Peptococcaceae bacterium]
MTIIPVLIFLAVFLFVLGVYGVLSGDRHQIQARLFRYTKEQAGGSEGNTKRELWRSLLRWGGMLFTSVKFANRVEERLAQADIPLRGEEFLFLVLSLTLGVPFVVVVVTGNLRFAVLCGLLACILPWIYINSKRQKRLGLLNNQLADSLSIMTNALRAGYSFLQAMEMVAMEAHPPLAGEYKRALREMQLGAPVEAALNNMSRRVGSEDLDLVITAMLTQRQVGGNLAEVLDNIGETIRERVKIKGEIKTLTAQGRISGLIIGLLPVLLVGLLLVINPQYIGVLFREPLGLALLVGAVCGELVGVLFIKRIVDIKV